jgi:hypothetical protein
VRDNPESALVSSKVGVRWSPAYKDVSREAEERPPLEALTEQRV